MRRGSRKLEGDCTDFGCGVAHGFWRREGARSAQLGRLVGAGCGQLFGWGVVVGWLCCDCFRCWCCLGCGFGGRRQIYY